MEKGNKMYSFEIVDKATSAVAMGFSCDTSSFKKSVEELPEEIQAMVIFSVLAGQMALRAQMRKVLSKTSEIQNKLKEMKNPTKEDIEKLFREALEKMGEEK